MDSEWISRLMEIMSQLGSMLDSVWGWFVGMVPTLDGICVSFITYYTFRLTVFPKRLKFISLKVSRSNFDGDSLEITLENRSLCPAVIESVDLIVGSKKVKFFSGECIVDGFKTAKIEMPRYSQIISDTGVVDIDICAMNNISLLVRTTRGIQHVRYKTISKMACRRIRKLEDKYDHTTVCRHQYGDRIVVPGVRYALSYVDPLHNEQVVFIHQSGIMSSAPFGYNRLPEEIMKSEATIRSHFDAEFTQRNLPYHLEVFGEQFPIEEAEGNHKDQQGDCGSPTKKKKTKSATSFVLIMLFAFSLSLTWDIIKLVDQLDRYARLMPLVQSLCLAGYIWMSMVSTNDIQIFNDFIEATSRRKRWIGHLARNCAYIVYGLPFLIMMLVEVFSVRGREHRIKQYKNDLKRKLEDFDTKPLVVRAFLIPATIIFVVNILLVGNLLSDNLVPIVQNGIDALVSVIGLAFVLANVKQKNP